MCTWIPGDLIKMQILRFCISTRSQVVPWIPVCGSHFEQQDPGQSRKTSWKGRPVREGQLGGKKCKEAELRLQNNVEVGRECGGKDRSET